MKRGDIHWVHEQLTTGSEIKKKRPWVVMGANPINRARKTIVAIPLSTSAPVSPPISISVAVLGGLAVAVCDQIRAIDKGNFENPPVDRVSEKDMTAIEDGLKQVLAL
jgi:mRNA interferase MazF